jgi:hypothetical protein
VSGGSWRAGSGSFGMKPQADGIWRESGGGSNTAPMESPAARSSVPAALPGAERDRVAFRPHVPRLAAIPRPVHASRRRAVFVPAKANSWAVSGPHLAHIAMRGSRTTPV